MCFLEHYNSSCFNLNLWCYVTAIYLWKGEWTAKVLNLHCHTVNRTGILMTWTGILITRNVVTFYFRTGEEPTCSCCLGHTEWAFLGRFLSQLDKHHSADPISWANSFDLSHHTHTSPASRPTVEACLRRTVEFPADTFHCHTDQPCTLEGQVRGACCKQTRSHKDQCGPHRIQSLHAL